MAVANAAHLPKIEKTSQEIDNLSFDTENNVKVVELLGNDGTSLQRLNADALAVKVTESGSNTFVGIAAPGTAQSSAFWQCKKITDSSGTTTVLYADGNSNFDNIATDLTALSYS